jgi:hypothetical protein
MFDQLGYTLGLGDNPAGGALKQGMEDAARAYEAYRPEAWAARMGALQHTMDMFQPVNAQLTKLYGAGAAVPLSAAFDYARNTPPPSAVVPSAVSGGKGGGKSPLDKYKTPGAITALNTTVGAPLLGIPLLGDAWDAIF